MQSNQPRPCPHKQIWQDFADAARRRSGDGSSDPETYVQQTSVTTFIAELQHSLVKIAHTAASLFHLLEEAKVNAELLWQPPEQPDEDSQQEQEAGKAANWPEL